MLAVGLALASIPTQASAFPRKLRQDFYAISRDPKEQDKAVSYWDAAILEAARSLGCEVVLSEDLHDGEDYAGVRVENPFRATN